MRADALIPSIISLPSFITGVIKVSMWTGKILDLSLLFRRTHSLALTHSSAHSLTHSLTLSLSQSHSLSHSLTLGEREGVGARYGGRVTRTPCFRHQPNADIPEDATEIQTPMAQGRSSEVISTIEWIRTSRLSIKDSLSPDALIPAST